MGPHRSKYPDLPMVSLWCPSKASWLVQNLLIAMFAAKFGPWDSGEGATKSVIAKNGRTVFGIWWLIESSFELVLNFLEYRGCLDPPIGAAHGKEKVRSHWTVRAPDDSASPLEPRHTVRAPPSGCCPSPDVETFGYRGTWNLNLSASLKASHPAGSNFPKFRLSNKDFGSSVGHINIVVPVHCRRPSPLTTSPTCV